MNWILLISTLITIEQPHDGDAAVAALRREGAYGPLQIRAGCLKDVNHQYRDEILRKFGRPLRLQDCLERDVASWVCRRYLEHYGKEYRHDTGKAPTIETYCRIWNSGPQGWKGHRADRYWKKARIIIERNKPHVPPHVPKLQRPHGGAHVALL